MNEVVRAMAELQRRVDRLERPKTSTPTIPLLSNVTKTISTVRAVSEVADQALYDANNITETQILPGSIKTPHLDANVITGDKISANALNGKTITGAFIFGGTIIGGLFQTRSTGSHVGIFGGTESFPGYIYGTTGEGSSVWNLGEFGLTMRETSGTVRVDLNPDGLTFYDAAGNDRISLASDRAIFSDAAGTETLTIRTGSTYPQQRLESNTALALFGGGVNGLIVQSNGVALQNYLYMNFLRTTTFPANMHWSSGDAQVYQVSSMGINKLDQQPITLAVAEKILNLTPKTWRDRGEVADDPDTERRVPGLIAEEVVAISQANDGVLRPLIAESRSEGTAIIGINYDRLPAYLIPLIRAHRDQIADLNARIAALETS